MRLLVLHGRIEGDGVIPATYSNPAYLAHRWGADAGFIEAGLTKAIAANLLTELTDGSLQIVGWDDKWRPPLSDAERQRRCRERHRRVTASHVASRDVTSVTLPDQTRPDQTRSGEEISVCSANEVSRNEQATLTGLGPVTEPAPKRSPRKKPGRPAAQDKQTGITPKQLLPILGDASGGKIAIEPVDGRMWNSLWAVCRAMDEAGLTLEDAKQAGEWIRAGGEAWRGGLGITWITKTGNLLGAVGQARKWHSAGRPSLEAKGANGKHRGRIELTGKEDYSDTKI